MTLLHADNGAPKAHTMWHKAWLEPRSEHKNTCVHARTEARVEEERREEERRGKKINTYRENWWIEESGGWRNVWKVKGRREDRPRRPEKREASVKRETFTGWRKKECFARSCERALRARLSMLHVYVCMCREKKAAEERKRASGWWRCRKRSSTLAKQKGTKLISEALTNYFLRKGVGYLQLSPIRHDPFRVLPSSLFWLKVLQPSRTPHGSLSDPPLGETRRTSTSNGTLTKKNLNDDTRCLPSIICLLRSIINAFKWMCL